MRTLVAVAVLALIAAPGANSEWVAKGTYKAKVVYDEYTCKKKNDIPEDRRFECQWKKNETYAGDVYFPRWIEVRKMGEESPRKIMTKDIAAIAVLDHAIKRKYIMHSRETQVFLRDGRMLTVVFIEYDVFLMPPGGKQLKCKLASSGAFCEDVVRVITRVEFNLGKNLGVGK